MTTIATSPLSLLGFQIYDVALMELARGAIAGEAGAPRAHYCSG